MTWQTNTFNQVIVIGSGGGEFVYDGSGNLRSANVGAVTTDPLTGVTCQQGFTTFNGHGAAVNYLSTATLASGFVQYVDNNSAVQGGVILSVNSETVTWIEPYHGTTIQLGLQGIDPVFGDFFTSVGALLNLGQSTYTSNVRIQAVGGGGGASQPRLEIAAPEQSHAGHAVLEVYGSSTDGTRPAQMEIGTANVATPTSLALLELQGALALINAALPAFVSTAFQASSVSGVLTGITGSGGLSGTVPLTQVDHTTFTVTAAAATQASKAWSIPANDANVDTVYRLTVHGFGTQGTTVQNLTVSIVLNGTVIISATMTGLTPISASLRFKFTLDYHILTTGAGGTSDSEASASWSTTASPVVSGTADLGSSAAGSRAFDTTAANTLQLDLAWASVTGAPTMTTFFSTFERLGP